MLAKSFPIPISFVQHVGLNSSQFPIFVCPYQIKFNIPENINLAPLSRLDHMILLLEIKLLANSTASSENIFCYIPHVTP